MQNLELKAGELIVFSSGDYSDYGYHGAYVVLEDVSQEQVTELAQRIKAEGKVKMDNYYSGFCENFPDLQNDFQMAMIKHGWLGEINLREIHLGSYGELDPS